MAEPDPSKGTLTEVAPPGTGMNDTGEAECALEAKARGPNIRIDPVNELHWLLRLFLELAFPSVLPVRISMTTFFSATLLKEKKMPGGCFLKSDEVCL